MQFEHTDKVKALIARLEACMDEYVYPTEPTDPTRFTCRSSAS